MKKIIQFGERVEGYEIPVLNEREIRAAAGILFLLMFVAILVVVLKGDFLLLKYAITIFLTDISIRGSFSICLFPNPRTLFSNFSLFSLTILKMVKDYTQEGEESKIIHFLTTSLVGDISWPRGLNLSIIY